MFLSQIEYNSTYSYFTDLYKRLHYHLFTVIIKIAYKLNFIMLPRLIVFSVENMRCNMYSSFIRQHKRVRCITLYHKMLFEELFPMTFI